MNYREKMMKQAEACNLKAKYKADTVESLPPYLQCPRTVTLQTPEKHLREKMSYFPWLSYSVHTVEDALLLVELFGLRRSIEKHTNGATCVAPFIYIDKQYLLDEPNWTVEEGLIVRQHRGKGFGTTAIEFWPVNWPVKVRITIEKDLPWKLWSTISMRYDTRGNVTSSQVHIKRLSNVSVLYGGGYGVETSVDYLSIFESTTGALRVLCAEEGYK